MSNHITHAAIPYPIRGCRFTIAIPYLDSDGDPTDPNTPDTEVSRDGLAYADCVEEITTIPGANGSGYLTLTGDELDAALVFLAAKVASGPKATLATLYPRILPVIRTGVAAAGAASSITLDADSVATDDYYNGAVIRTTGGTGGGGGTGSRDNQARVITDYAGSTRVATVTPGWETVPDATTTYEILATEMSGHSIGVTAPILSLPSQVDVANLALIKLGDVQITTFDDDSAHARVVKLLYPRVIDAVLRDHKWRFAVRQATLAQLAGAPTWRYQYRYQLPTDPYCLRIIRSSTEDPALGNNTPWEIQGREILTDATAVNIEYIARIVDPQQWDVQFLDAVVERLASELSMPITNTPTLRSQLLQGYVMKIDAAKSTDGMEGTPDVITDTQLLDVR